MIELAAAILAKSFVVAIVVLSVLHTGLNDFQKALIIAVTSGAITGMFTIVAAFIAARLTRPIRKQVDEVHEKVLADNKGDA